MHSDWMKNLPWKKCQKLVDLVLLKIRLFHYCPYQHHLQRLLKNIKLCTPKNDPTLKMRRWTPIASASALRQILPRSGLNKFDNEKDQWWTRRRWMCKITWIGITIFSNFRIFWKFNRIWIAFEFWNIIIYIFQTNSDRDFSLPGWFIPYTAAIYCNYFECILINVFTVQFCS